MASRTDGDVEGFVGGDDEGRPGLPVDPGRLWLSVKRDWRWIPIAAGAWGALGLIVAFVFITHLYRADVVVVWQPAGTIAYAERQLATESAAIKLPASLRQVNDRLKLNLNIRQLNERIDVFFDQRTNLVTVSALGKSRPDAVLLANAVISAFFELQTRSAGARAAQTAAGLDAELSDARSHMTKAREALDAFRNESGVADIDEESSLAIKAAQQANDQLQQARSDASMLAARIQGLGAESRRQPRMAVSGSSTSNSSAQKLADLRTELATASARYAPEHPRIVSLQAQIASLEAHVGSSTGVVSGVTTSLNPEYQTLQGSLANARAEQDAAEKRVKSSEQNAKSAELRVATLSALQGKAHSVTAEVELLEKRVQDLESQLATAQATARTPPLDWRVLTPAAEPEWPERSKRRLVVFGMPVAGALVALLVLLLRPTIDGRVYTAREAAYWANLPVVGSSAWPRDREMFFTLVDELGDHGTAARGCTLIFGASESERVLAEELAYWLGGNPSEARKVAGMATTRLEMPAQAGPSFRQVEHAGDVSPRSAAPGFQNTPVASGEALMRMQQHAARLGPFRLEGAQAWGGVAEGPSLRRAARMADRVLVLLGSGAEVVSSIAGLRTRLGRDQGVGIVMLGMNAELLKLPDRAGNVEAFWRASAGGR